MGGIAPRLGTNPLAIGVPDAGGPLILDFGTSATAEGKVRVKKIAGQLCPDGWLLDSDGEPTNDPNKLYADPPGTILPMGGDQAYKGFGLALMVEIFAGALSGGICSARETAQSVRKLRLPATARSRPSRRRRALQRTVSGLIDFVRSCPTRGGVGEILLPGDPERHVLAKRTAEGIPFDDGNWRQLAELAERLKVTVPNEN